MNNAVQPVAARILFVDDEDSVRAAFARAMNAQGFNVDVAANGNEALKLAELYSYPVVATDLTMPDLDGISLIRQLHQKSPATVFVIITGASKVQVPTDSELRDHVSSIVSKPFDVKELADTLRRSLHIWESRTRKRRIARESHGEANDTILLIEDNDADADLVEAFLLATCHRGKVTRVTRVGDALRALEDKTYGVVITDLSLPDARGLDAVLRIQNTASETPLIVLSSQNEDGIAVQALQAGAQDFLLKSGVDARTLMRSIQYARERKRSEKDLANLAHFDPLTGLANRAHFSQCLNSTLSRARRTQDPFAVLFVDLDNFKPINDDHGHAAGDAVLVEVSRRLEDTLREYDTVARLGGDEFAIVLERLANPSEATLIAGRLLHAVGQPFAFGDIEVNVTASIGIALYPDDGKSVGDLVEAADRAMYEAKRQGRNTFAESTRGGSDSSGVHARAPIRAMFTDEELTLEYRPRFDVAQGKVVAVEAVLRWRQDVSRPRAPGDLLSAVGETQELSHATKWMIESAFRELARLQRSRPFIRRVCLAVSSSRFLVPGLVDDLLTVAKETNLQPSNLELSLPEASLMRAPNEGLLAELRNHGVHLSMSEFGAGGSSLMNFCSLPLDGVHLSPCFWSDSPCHPRAYAVVAGIVAMAQEQDVIVVAPNVETQSELNFLLRANCQLVQGTIVEEQLAPKELALVG